MAAFDTGGEGKNDAHQDVQPPPVGHDRGDEELVDRGHQEVDAQQHAHCGDRGGGEPQCNPGEDEPSDAGQQEHPPGAGQPR